MRPAALGAGAEGREDAIVGAGHEGLRAEIAEHLEQRFPPGLVEMGGDLVKEDDGRLAGEIGDEAGLGEDEAKAAIEAEDPLTVDILYGDHEGGQRTVTRFALLPHSDGVWLASAGRYWNVDRDDPRPTP